MSTDIKKAYRRLRQFGGVRLLREYAGMGLVGAMLRRSLFALFHGRTLKSVYPALLAVTVPYLLDKYRPLMLRLKEKYNDESTGEAQPVIWSCWLQGIDHAPALVRACIASQRMAFPERKHVVLSAETYKDYITLPEYIERKYNEGIIPPALFSDLLRLELLIRHGGTWMDASVLCTGNNCPGKVLDCDLFMFQYTRPGCRTFGRISNWFMTARPDNHLLKVLRDLLYQYWYDYDCVMDYYIFHHFFGMIAAEYPVEISKMPRGYSSVALLLGNRLNDGYNEEWMNRLASICCFHKTNYRDSITALRNPHSFCSEIIRCYTIKNNDSTFS